MDNDIEQRLERLEQLPEVINKLSTRIYFLEVAIGTCLGSILADHPLGESKDFKAGMLEAFRKLSMDEILKQQNMTEQQEAALQQFSERTAKRIISGVSVMESAFREDNSKKVSEAK